MLKRFWSERSLDVQSGTMMKRKASPRTHPNPHGSDQGLPLFSQSLSKVLRANDEVYHS